VGLLPPGASFARLLFPEQIEHGEFEDAVKTLEDGLDAPDVTDELVELYRLLGLTHLRALSGAWGGNALSPSRHMLVMHPPRAIC
jgi:hypothetical protein